IVPAVNECNRLAIIAMTKQGPAFHAFAEENIAGFWNKFFPRTAVARRIQMPVFRRDCHRPFRSQPICPYVAWEFAGISLAWCGVFVIAQYLSRDDLPATAAPHPGISFVITRRQVLPE